MVRSQKVHAAASCSAKKKKTNKNLSAHVISCGEWFIVHSLCVVH